MGPLKNITAFVIVLLMAGTPTCAQFLWSKSGVPVRQDYQIDWFGWTAKNGVGDIYAAWEDGRSNFPRIFCQKFNQQGEPLWLHDVEVDHPPVVQMVICPTSDNGLVVAWGTFVPYVYGIIHAQKIDAEGNLQWPLEGVIVGRYIYSPGDEGKGQPLERGAYSDFNLVADTSGGMFFIWADEIAGNQAGVLAKHLLSDGSLAPGWLAHGNVIKEGVVFLENGYDKCSCEDGDGGFIVSWREYVGSSTYSVNAQRVSGAGDLLWAPQGLLLCSTGYNRTGVARDEAGGAYFVWEDKRSGSTDLYMQRVDHAGNVLWQSNGLPLIHAANHQCSPRVVEDDSGGMLVAWGDGSNYYTPVDVYVQRVNQDGVTLWAPHGVMLSTAQGTQNDVRIDGDGAGGLFAVWEHYTSYSGPHEAYIQNITGAGSPAWQVDGILLRKGAGGATVAGANDGGALFFWTERRNCRAGLYLQKTDAAGQFQFPPTGQPFREAIAGSVLETSALTALTSNRYLSVWMDTRRYFPTSMYISRVVYFQIQDAQGNAVLQPDGAALCDDPGDHNQLYPKAAATSDGGAVIAWADYRDLGNWSLIYVQKIDAQGNLLWSTRGVPAIVSQWSPQGNPFVCSDGAGGAYVIMLWAEEGLCIQRLDANGNRLFGPNGLTLPGTNYYLEVVGLLSDEENGAIVVYGIHQEEPIYAIRILSSGVVGWTSTVYYLPGSDPGEVIAIGAHGGGVIVAWEDYRNGYVGDIYAQKLDDLGNVLWTVNGVPVINGPAIEFYPSLAEDDNGCIFVSWQKGYGDIYCQRLNADGERLFPPEGIVVCDALDEQESPVLIGDGLGGAIISWSDWRYWTGSHSVSTYMTHLDSSGQIANPFWIPNGNPICPSPSYQGVTGMVPDGSGGAVVTWQEEARGLYAQRVNDYFGVGRIAMAPGSVPKDVLSHVSPNPFNPSTAISFELRAASFVKLAVYDVSGRLVATLVDGWREAGTREATFDGSDLPSGIYVYRLTAGEIEASGKMLLLK